MTDAGLSIEPAGDCAAWAWPRFIPVGDIGLLVEFGNEIEMSLNQAVVGLDRAIIGGKLPGVVETVPTYRSLLIEFEPGIITLDQLVVRVRDLLRNSETVLPDADRKLVVPVSYDGVLGEDLAEAAGLLGLAPHVVVDAHLTARYRVYMIGFMPGFAYLGGLPSQLHLPRRAKPRAPAPEGSIMIGGKQAAIAALPFLTGWYVIGRTPARGFDKNREEPFLFRAGDHVQFDYIGASDFARLAVLAAKGAPVVKIIG